MVITNDSIPDRSVTTTTYGDAANADMKLKGMLTNVTRSHSIYGHTIDSLDEKIVCTRCDLELEIPDLLLKTAPFVQVVYRLHLYEQLREKNCDFSGVDVSDDGVAGGGIVRTNPNDVVDSDRLYYSATGETVRLAEVKDLAKEKRRTSRTI